MFFASPIWLLALLPWAGVTLYLLWGRAQKVKVPFLALWEIPDRPPPPRRSLTWPPVAVAMMILAMLAAIVGAARPALRIGQQHSSRPVTLIVDRGVTMSARGHSDLRYREAGRLVIPELDRLFGDAPVDLLVVPGQASLSPQSSVLSPQSLPSALSRLVPTAAATGDGLRAAVARALAETSGLVVVVSDQDLGRQDARLIQVPPATDAENVDIVTLAARMAPQAQLLLRVRNQSSQTAATVSVSTDGRTHATDVELPPRDQEKDYFLDLPSVGSTIHVVLQTADDLAFDNEAWLVRANSFPRIELRTAVSPELRHMIETYQRLYPPGEDAPVIAVVARADQLAEGERGVVLGDTANRSPAHEPVAGTQATAELTVTAHSVTAHVDWSVIAKRSGEAAAPPAMPSPDWTPLVQVGPRVLLAESAGSVRRLWVGFDDPDFVRTPGYPMFWKDVFDYVGQGRETFMGQSIGPLGTDWTIVETVPSAEAPAGADLVGWLPGLYRRTDGQLRAVNALDVLLSAAERGPWRDRLAASAGPQAKGVALAPMVWLAAIALVLLAAGTWRKATGPPAPSGSGSRL